MNAIVEKTQLQTADAIGGLVASAVLVDLNISVWVGRKTDKKNTKKVVEDAGATSNDAAHVTKKLFVGNPKLEEVMRRATAARAYVADRTLPWMGDLKLLPMTQYLTFQDDMEDLKAEFDNAVNDFLKDYDIQVSAMAFKLGALFDRKEYPSAHEIRNKFDMSWSISPLPAAGDFRVEAEAELRKNLQRAYQEQMEKRIQSSMTTMWTRLKETLEHMVDRLGETDGKPNIFRDSMLENAKELVNLLRDFNLANDPKMEQARKQLMAIIDGVEPDELRKNKDVRADVRANVSDILSKFNF